MNSGSLSNSLRVTRDVATLALRNEGKRSDVATFHPRHEGKRSRRKANIIYVPKKNVHPGIAHTKRLCNSFKLTHPNKPRRLAQVFQSYDAPVYFVTFCTSGRRPVLATDTVHDRLRTYAQKAEPRSIAIGRYVIMPDHIHCFIRMSPQHKLGTTIRMLKRALSAAIEVPAPHWQPGFFDHLLRHSESYSEKWNYVYQNPVRAGLVERAEDWKFQGKATPIRF